MATQTRKLTVKNYDELLEKLPNSGIFDMVDCAVEIYCPEFAEVEEIQRMVTLVESMIHVTDVKIGSSVEDLVSDSYRVMVTEVSNSFTQRYKREK